MSVSSTDLARLLADVVPDPADFFDDDETLPQAPGTPPIDESDEAFARYAEFVHICLDFLDMSTNDIRESSNFEVGPSAEAVAPGECFARAAIRLYRKTSTGGTDVDRTSSGSPECPLCYERKANRIVLGCGHTACVSCLEKAVAASNGSRITECFKCRREPGVVVRAYD